MFYFEEVTSTVLKIRVEFTFASEDCVKKQDSKLTNEKIQHIIIKNLTEQSDKSYEQK